MKDFSINSKLNEKADTGRLTIEDLEKKIKDAKRELDKAVDLINKDGGLGYVDYSHIDGEIDEIVRWKENYASFANLTWKYKEEVDSVFHSAHNKAMEKLDDLDVDKMSVDNNLGIKETVSDENGNEYEITKSGLTFEDLLNYNGVSDIMKKQYEDYKKNMEEQGKEYKDTFKEFIKKSITAGEITYESDTEKWISLCIDVLPIIGDGKALIEAVTGIDIVTGRKLSEIERGLSLLAAIPLVGDGATVAKVAAKGSYKDLIKVYSKELLKNSMAMGTNIVVGEVAESYGVSPLLGLATYHGSRIVAKNLGPVLSLIKNKNLKQDIMKKLCKYDPINVSTGSFDLEAVDLVMKDRGLDVDIKRVYDTRDKSIGVFGRGWSFEYESYIEIDNENEVVIVYPHGDIKNFLKVDGVWVNKSSKDESEVFTQTEDNGYILNVRNKKSYGYDNEGKLVYIIDKNNNKVDLSYDEEGNISKITSPGGKTYTFKCSSNKIIEITDNIGRKTTYIYEGDNLVQVVLANQGVVTYRYNENNLINSIIDQEGNCYVKNEYDELGRVIRQYDKDGNIIDIEYNDAAKENIFTIHATGVVEKYKYNEKNIITEIVYMDGTSESYTFDEYGNKVSQTDRNGNTIYRIYDSKGNVLEEVAPNGYSVKNYYDEDNNLIKKEGSAGGEILFKYDNRGNLLEEAIKLNDEAYAKTTFTYDEFGRLLSKTDAENNTISYEYKYDHLDKPTTIIDAEGNIFRYEFDEAGRMLSVNTTYGTVKFAYNELNKRTHITDAKGNTRRLIYDKMGNVKKEILPNFYNSKTDSGVGYKYSYDVFDRLIESTDPIDNVKAVKYDVNGNLIKTINSNYYDKGTKDGIGIIHKYDAANNKIKDIYPTGEESRIKYDPAGNMIKVIDAVRYDKDLDDGQGIEYTYNEMGRMVLIKDPEGNIVSKFIYDHVGNLVKAIKAKGYMSGDRDENRYGTLYKYNLAGWLLEKREPVEEESGNILYNVTLFNYDKLGRKIEEKKSSEYVNETSYPENWNTIKYEYDKNSRIIKVTDTLGAEIEYDYDCLSNKTGEKAKISEGTYKITKYNYDSIGRLERVVELLDAEDFGKEDENTLEGKVEAETKYEYDANGNVIKVISPEGYITHLYYDKADRLIQITEGAKKEGQASRVTLFKYDKEGNIIKETDCNGNSTTYEYDSMNRMTTVIDKEGGITKLYYDGAGNLIKHVNPENHDEEKGSTYSYDNMNRLVEITNALGVIVKKNKYNIQGELVEEVDALNLGTEYKYNIGGRVKEMLTPKARQIGRPSQKYTYDSLGNITGVRDGEGNETTYKLDLWGRVTEINKADGSKEWYSYNYAGNITSTTDGNGHKIEYTYNSLNLLSQIKDQAGKSEFFKYDKQGRMAKHINRNQNGIEYLYNRDNNLLRRKDEKTGFFEEYSYNIDGRLMSAASGDNIYSYEYTPNGNLKSKSINGKPVLQYRYNKNNKVIELKDLAGRSTNYKYDTIGRVKEVLADNESVATYSYNPDGTTFKIKYGNGININYSYDEDKNLTAILGRNFEGSEVINHKYKYNNNGYEIEKEESGKRTYYFYDSLQRLGRAEYPEYTETFEYDNAGNRIRRITDDCTTIYKYSNRNRLIAKKENEDFITFFHDEQGNLKSEIRERSSIDYTYDCFNRTESVKKSDGTYIKNTYNPEGLRSEIDENGVISKFVFDGRNVVTELDEEDKLKNSIIRGHGIISQRDSKDKDYYYINNDHGDVTKVIDWDGIVRNSYRYDAFGNTIEEKEQVHNRFRYSGEQHDSVTGQYYLRARFYNPVVGRFTQEDIYRGDGLNLYAYVGNNPVNYVDPSGFDTSPPLFHRAAYIGDFTEENFQQVFEEAKRQQERFDVINPGVELRRGIDEIDRGNMYCVLLGRGNLDSKANEELQRHNINGIQYTNKRPNFTPVASIGVEIDNMTDDRTSKDGNYNQARRAMAEAIIDSQGDIDRLIANGHLTSETSNHAQNTLKDFIDNHANEILNQNLDREESITKIKSAIINRLEKDSNRKQVFTWHEVDTRRMQLVPTIINSRFGHAGGVSDIRAILNDVRAIFNCKETNIND